MYRGTAHCPVRGTQFVCSCAHVFNVLVHVYMLWLSHLDPVQGGPRKVLSLFLSLFLNVRGGVPSATNEKKQLDRLTGQDRSAVGLVRPGKRLLGGNRRHSRMSSVASCLSLSRLRGRAQLLQKADAAPCA